MTGHKGEIDSVTGVETTGHEWDGVKELNKPLPRWWLLTFYATIIWAVGYWIVYPAWPTLTGYTQGVIGYSQREALSEEMKIARSAHTQFRDKLAAARLDRVQDDPELLRFAMAGGSAAFQAYCAACHGRGAQGFAGYPNLNDDDWLWGGTIDDIHNTISFGIRSDHAKARVSQMPRYGLDKLLDDKQINDLAEFVLSLTGKAKDNAAVTRGQPVFAEQCATCHGPDGKGKQDQGAPNLADGIWLYGDSKSAVVDSIRTGRGGMMLGWADRLDPVTVKALAVYVHSLGGGK
jgi:cytochrome c oxidase cbb3-type subunit III